MNKIKICLISRSAYPLFNSNCKQTFGGAEVDLYYISKILARDSLYDVNFIVGNFKQKKIELFDNVRVFRSYRFNDNKIIQILKLIITFLKVNADIYMQEGASGGTGIISFLCKIMNKKFVYRTASDIDCDGTFVEKHFIEGSLYKWGIKHANVLITQNISNKNQLKKIFNLFSIVIPNGIEIYQKGTNIKNTILWVGRSEKLKQPLIFLDIAKQFPKEKFVMVCSKANFNSIDISDLNKKASEIPNLELIAYVPFIEINKYYANAKIFINTSIYEGFPNTFIQSVINSVPIITLNVNPDNFLTEYSCGYCANGNFFTMVSKIRQIIENRDEWKKLSDNSYNYGLKNSNINVIIDVYKKIFLNLSINK